MSTVAATQSDSGELELGHLRISWADIPAMSSASAQMLAVASRPETTAAELESVISRDPSFLARVLTVANSTYYGCSGHIDSVNGAMMLLGERQVRAIAAALSTQTIHDETLGPGLWRHALACGLWTRIITRQLKLPEIPHLFAAAMMHDVGITLLVQKRRNLVEACLKRAAQTDMPYHDVERELLGTDHAELGALACERWHLPATLVRIVREHHSTNSSSVESAVVRMADDLAHAAGLPEFDTRPQVHWPDRHELDVDFEALLERRGHVVAEVDAMDPR